MNNKFINGITELVTHYQLHFDEFHTKDYNEARLRNDFIDPFFKILGWDVNNQKGKTQFDRDVEIESSVYVTDKDEIKRKKKPDYSFRYSGKTKFFVETKKPSVNILESKSAVYQARRYGWSANLKIIVLTNFNDLVIYDATVRPYEDDSTNIGLVARYNYTEFIKEANEIYLQLSKESVENGTFDNRFSNIKSTFTKEPFDQYFLQQISGWRLSLARNIYKNNSINISDLNLFVQKLINRSLFLRICEDNQLENYRLNAITNYDDLKSVFLAADKKYNSGLFALIDRENFIIDPQILVDFFQDLYYPKNSYEFSVIEPSVLGYIYDSYLCYHLVVDDSNEVQLKFKPEYESANGIVTTPSFIANSIIKDQIDNYIILHGGKIKNDFRIADVSCGSGIFLLSAFDYLMNYYLNRYVEEDAKKYIKVGYIVEIAKDTYDLTLKRKISILQQHIFGVDIDPSAVEITKFSLLIKCVETSSSNEVNYLSQSLHQKILPNIDFNIQNGNSIVDEKIITIFPEILDKPEIFKEINPFNWEKHFFSTFNKKFDIIIGNPPYVRVQKMKSFSPFEYTYLKSEESNYLSSQESLVDKYYFFVERVMNLIDDSGSVGLITSNKFLSIKSGKILRKFLMENKYIKKIVDYGANQLFSGHLTYTCILSLTKSENKQMEYIKIDKEKQEIASPSSTYGYDEIKDDYKLPFISILKFKNRKQLSRLGEICDTFVGLQTSADDIYIINPENIDMQKGLVKFIDKENQEWIIEKDILKPFIYKVKINKYHEIKANRMIIFPYELVNGKGMLLSINKMQNLYPYAYNYLKKFKNDLLNRSVSHMGETNWYQFGRAQSISKFSSNAYRLIWSVLTLGSNFVYNNNDIMFTGGGHGPYYAMDKKETIKESIFYIQAILNSTIVEDLVRSASDKFAGDYSAFSKQFIDEVPIRRIDFTNPKEIKIHDDIVKNVDSITRLVKEKDNYVSQSEINRYEKIIELKEQQNATLIDFLYEMSGD